MLSKSISELLNTQYNGELFAANQYRAMSSWLLSNDLDGMASFFNVQADEELMHAQKIFAYVHDADGKIEMEAVQKPQTSFKSVQDLFEKALGQEQKVTASINRIVKQCLDEGDYASQTFLNWFVTEQIEEEALFKNLIAKIKRVGDNQSALYLLDMELGKRGPATAE